LRPLLRIQKTLRIVLKVDAKKYARSEWSVDIHVKAAVIIMTILDKMIQLGIIQLSV
jgi:hypothetical protein